MTVMSWKIILCSFFPKSPELKNAIKSSVMAYSESTPAATRTFSSPNMDVAWAWAQDLHELYLIAA